MPEGGIRLLERKRYTCIKCGKTFTKMVGGIVVTPRERELELCPVCDKCKLGRIADIFKR